MKHYLIIEDEEKIVHFESSDACDYTLCGLSLSAQMFEFNNPATDYDALETRLKVNCPRCIQIVKHCKSIKSTEIKKL